ncbi:hypothetical protein GCM10009846_13570 [Agrococcus versicolor]|uniref:DUF3239 domain-containing protein n=1 Tax=Agrococcus versicolor TaxID=501482 RepID=A0ABP5MF62_9MICO
MQLDTATWTRRLDMRQPVRDRSGYIARRGVVSIVFGILTLVGVVLLVAGVVQDLAAMGVFIVVIVTFFVGLVALIQRGNAVGIARLRGDDLIVAIVLDEGIVVQGGLPIAWTEVSKVLVTRVRRGGRGIAGATTRAMMRADGVSDVWTTMSLELRDWPPIEARATTKAMATTLTRPIAGLTASALVNLGTLPETDVQQVLAAVVQQAQRHGIPVDAF